MSAPVDVDVKTLLEKLYQNENKTFTCRVCVKSFTTRQNRWRHEQTCKAINNNNNESKKHKKTSTEIKSKLHSCEKEIKTLRLEIQNLKNKIRTILSNIIRGLFEWWS